MAAELNDVIQLLRMRGKVQRGEDFADECAHHGKRQRCAACVRPLLLKKRVGDGRKNDMPIFSWRYFPPRLPAAAARRVTFKS